MRFRNCSSRLVVPALALAAALGTAASAQAQTTTVCLVAKPFAATGAAGVAMWGYAEAPYSGGACQWESAGSASSPGPRITMPASSTTLEVQLQNQLPVPTSIVIPGLPSPGLPTRVDGRARSFTTEVGAAGSGSSVGTYTWHNVRPGTYLYQSGSHVQVQVQMGLYGAVTKDFANGQAYEGKSYASEVVLFYSEVDPALHYSVAAGAYNGIGGLIPAMLPGGYYPTPPVPMTSTFNYKPRYFLVNGEAYPGASTAVTAGKAGTAILIRLLNAGLRTHVPTLLNGDFELVAEDAHPYGYSRRQVQVSLLAGKTMDVLWTPAFAGTYPIFDRTPHLTTDGGGPGGMIATLTVGGSITAGDDGYGARNDKPLVVAAPGVMGNDSTISTATLVTAPANGSVALNPDGSFTYDPAGYTGVTSFTYQQPASNVATVTITTAPNAAPVALDAAKTTAEDTAAPIAIQATDANSDPLTYAIVTLPAHGTLSGTPPSVVYTPAPNYTGPDSFTFTASDDLLTSAVATVSISVTPVNDAPVAAPASWPTSEDTAVSLTLAGSDIDGNPLTFRITTNPANGALSGFDAATGQVTYTPKANYFGTDSFRFVVNDGTVDSPVATISLPVAAVPDNPTALNDAYSTKYNSSLTMNVLANDKDPDGTPLTIDNPAGAFPKCFNSTTGAFVSQGAACSTATGVDKVTIATALNRLTLVPNSGVRRNRTIVFTYQAKDTSSALSNSATVTVNVLR